MGSSLAEKDLEVLVGDKLDMSWQCPLAAQNSPVCWAAPQQREQQVKGGDSAPLLRSPETTLGVPFLMREKSHCNNLQLSSSGFHADPPLKRETCPPGTGLQSSPLLLCFRRTVAPNA